MRWGKDKGTIRITLRLERGQHVATAEYDCYRGQVERRQTATGGSRKQALARVLAIFRRNGHGGRRWEATGDCERCAGWVTFPRSNKGA